MERDINMKTTEELVEKVLNENIASSIYLDNCVYYEEDVKRMLIQTATEQETIDNEHISKITKVWMDKCNELVSLADERERVLIDKAVSIYEKELLQMKRILNELRDGAGELISIEGSLTQFRKALEE